MITKDFNSFEPFIGIVEDVDDPKKLGRVRIRVINHHTDDVKTEELDWATPIIPNSASLKGVGSSPTGLAVDSMVFGYYFDGKTRAMPLILGSFSKIPENKEENHDVHERARGENSLKNKQVGPEPKPEFAAEYPYNRVFATKAGHLIEVDDTEGEERIHVRHKSGSYIEINKDGRMVIKSVDDVFEIAAKDSHDYADGKKKIESKGALTLITKDKVTIESKGACKVKSSKKITLVAPTVDLYGKG